ncbi:VCBS repeat-containing protein [Pararhodonellum marinum]|uniref:VCBS repeat-containing protein n=1 Tax=Pararhodonellum marinum TaxID=2755358 RepID=UPI00188FB298|nr:VCBS repeat-containing protein [Pararhodonellum marinum]
MNLKIDILFFLLAVSILGLASCRQTEEEKPLFQKMPASHTNIHFSNDILTNDTLNALNYDYIYNGGGVAVGDVNNDGLPDLFFSGNMVSSRLYLNKGNFEFEDITVQAGIETDVWVTGASMVDINGNGLTDIYLSVANKNPELSANRLYVNNGDGTFSEKAEEFGIADRGYSTHAAFFDFDRDGHLDLYVLTNAYETSNKNFVRPKKTQGEAMNTDRLYRNNGDGTFTEVSEEAGILIEGYGLGVAIADFNLDGWPDIYVANDFLTNDLLWINNQDGTFTDQAGTYLKHQSFNGMGVDVADFNNDGYVDIAVMDMLPPDNLRQKTMFPDINYNQFRMILSLGYTPQYVRNTLQMNNGNGTFSEIGQLAGMHETDWSWAPLFADFNNSGFKDLFITNGYRKDVTNLDFIVYNREKNMFGTERANWEEAMVQLEKLPGAHVHNYMFKNDGSLIFKDVSESWGFGHPTYSNGAAFVDLDNDGDLDMVINNIDGEAGIYQNHSDQNRGTNWLQISLVGEAPNTQALGTKITLRTGETMQFHEHHLYRGYKSSISEKAHFGLGETELVDKIEVIWPDGRYQELHQVSANQRLTLKQEDAEEPSGTKPQSKKSKEILFTDISGTMGLQYKHEEMDYSDFKDQFLIPHKFSRNGPGMAVGDVNGDGLEDFYIGGAAGFSGQLFLQAGDGFVPKPFDFDPGPDETGALFFDANGNGHLDLYVVSGGSVHPQDSEHYQDRLYLNDGKGNFTLDEAALPKLLGSGSKVAAADFDGDGLLDLFVAGRVIPGQYPLAPKSYILKNKKGRFEDVTQQVLPELENLGLVTDAIWTDFDGDGKVDLIVVGEWMPIRFFQNQGGKFKEVTASTGLKNTSGWWNSITAGDFTGNGKTDYVLGNLGLNSKNKASKETPLRLYAYDFDRNSSIDPLMTRFIQGREYPVHPRDNLISQIPSMKRRFPRYQIYGEANIDNVLTKEERRNALQLTADHMASSFLENLGGGKFKLTPLPLEAQISPVFGLQAGDFDGDGHLDVLLAGNSYAAEIHSGWYDAGIGLLLKGNGKGDFTPIRHQESGFFVDTDAKGMVRLFSKNGETLILVSSNDADLKAFSAPSLSSKGLFRPETLDTKVVIQLKNGNQTIHELYHGSSYLSHSSRKIIIPENATQVTVFNSLGESRKLDLSFLNVTTWAN